jgi:cytochrome c oxidase cbb3-type subunit I/II
MIDPRAVTKGSVMPAYSWLQKDTIDFRLIRRKVAVMQSLGVPYTDADIEKAIDSAEAQARGIAAGMASSGVKESEYNREIMAVIAYLQRLGKDGQGLYK